MRSFAASKSSEGGFSEQRSVRGRLLLTRRTVDREIVIFEFNDLVLLAVVGEGILVVFDFADTHPVLFLFLNFFIAFCIGAAFLYRRELAELWMHFKMCLSGEEQGYRPAPSGGSNARRRKEPLT